MSYKVNLVVKGRKGSKVNLVVKGRKGISDESIFKFFLLTNQT